MSEQKLELEKINTGLVAFDKRKSELEALKAEASAVTIDGINDKEGYDKAVLYIRKLRENRVEITKEGKSMRDLINPINKMIISKENELVSIIESEENRLKALKDSVDEIKEEEKQNKIRQEKERIASRVRYIQDSGAKFDGISYRVNDIELEHDNIGKLSDEEWEKFKSLIAAEVENTKAQQKKEEEEKAAAAAEQERKEKELKEREEKIKAQEKEAEEQKKKNRIKSLSSLGFVFNGTIYRHESKEECNEKMFLLSDEDFDNAIVEITDRVSRFNFDKKEREEQEKAVIEKKKADEARKQLRQSRIEANGIYYSPIKNSFYYLEKEICISINLFELSDIQFEEEILKACEEIARIKEELEKAKAEERRVETIYNERSARLIALGFTLDEKSAAEEIHFIDGGITLLKGQIIEMEPNEFELICKEAHEFIINKKNQEQEEKQKLTEALLSDKEKLEMYCTYLKAVSVPKFRTNRYRELSAAIRETFELSHLFIKK